MKKALIVGINGQDGFFLTNFLLKKKYQVCGLAKKKISFNKKVKIFNSRSISLKYIENILVKNKFDEIYYLAAYSNVRGSWNNPYLTFESNYKLFYQILETVRKKKLNVKILNTLSSEIFVDKKNIHQNEKTIKDPRSPYAFFKAQSYELAIFYKKFFNLKIYNAILYNHESYKRPYSYFLQKITYAAACFSKGIYDSKKKDEFGNFLIKNGKVHVGNLRIKRDWGCAEEYVEVMWKILKINPPDDFVVATGISTSIKDVCKIVFGLVKMDWKKYVLVSNKFYRKHDTKYNNADINKIKKKLKWHPKKKINQILEEMLQHNIEKLK